MNPLALLEDVDVDWRNVGTNLAIGTLAGGATSYMIGRFYVTHESKWIGRNIGKLTGLGGKLLSVLVQVFGGPGMGAGWAALAQGADAVGQAGVDAMFLGLGLKHGYKKTGRTPVSFDGKSALPQSATPVQIGDLGRAPEGVGLSYQQMAELAAMR